MSRSSRKRERSVTNKSSWGYELSWKSRLFFCLLLSPKIFFLFSLSLSLSIDSISFYGLNGKERKKNLNRYRGESSFRCGTLGIVKHRRPRQDPSFPSTHNPKSRQVLLLLRLLDVVRTWPPHTNKSCRPTFLDGCIQRTYKSVGKREFFSSSDTSFNIVACWRVHSNYYSQVYRSIVYTKANARYVVLQSRYRYSWGSLLRRRRGFYFPFTFFFLSSPSFFYSSSCPFLNLLFVAPFQRQSRRTDLKGSALCMDDYIKKKMQLLRNKMASNSNVQHWPNIKTGRHQKYIQNETTLTMLYMYIFCV